MVSNLLGPELDSQLDGSLRLGRVEDILPRVSVQHALVLSHCSRR